MAAMPGGITVDQGLVSRPALEGAAARFGLRVHDDVQTYDGLQQAAGRGEPVLVDVRNQRFPDGHWLVVTAVTPQGVQVADSSGYHLTSMSREAFTSAWSGRGIRVEPGRTTAQSPTAGAY
jgi:ABC-type bacteriocin/lantibiotic exporter with double-glycine peptidase domain